MPCRSFCPAAIFSPDFFVQFAIEPYGRDVAGVAGEGIRIRAADGHGSLPDVVKRNPNSSRARIVISAATSGEMLRNVIGGALESLRDKIK